MSSGVNVILFNLQGEEEKVKPQPGVRISNAIARLWVSVLCLSFYKLSGPCFIRPAVGLDMSSPMGCCVKLRIGVWTFGPITARISCLQPMIEKLDFGPIRKKSAKYDDDAVHLLGGLQSPL